MGRAMKILGIRVRGSSRALLWKGKEQVDMAQGAELV